MIIAQDNVQRWCCVLEVLYIQNVISNTHFWGVLYTTDKLNNTSFIYFTTMTLHLEHK